MVPVAALGTVTVTDPATVTDPGTDSDSAAVTAACRRRAGRAV